MSFFEISLSKILIEFGEDNVKNVFSSFVCKDNLEVESFLKDKAINHEKKGLAKTVLILDSDMDDKIVAYYSISTKSFFIDTKLSTSIKRWIFGTSQTNGNIVPSILIGQLGKNEAVKETQFTGSNLMDFIFNYIRRMSVLTPSLVCYVEHDGKKKLRSYYEKHGFTYFVRKKDESKGLYCHIIKTDDVLKTFDKNNN